MSESKSSVFDELRRPFRAVDYELLLDSDTIASDGSINPYKVYIAKDAIYRRFDEVMNPNGWTVGEPVVSGNQLFVTVTLIFSDGSQTSRVGASWIGNGSDGAKGAVTNAVRSAMYQFGVSDHMQNYTFVLLNADEVVEYIQDVEDMSYEERKNNDIRPPKTVLSMRPTSTRTLQQVMAKMSCTEDELRSLLSDGGFGEVEDYLNDEGGLVKLAYIAKSLGVLNG